LSEAEQEIEQAEKDSDDPSAFWSPRVLDTATRRRLQRGRTPAGFAGRHESALDALGGFIPHPLVALADLSAELARLQRQGGATTATKRTASGTRNRVVAERGSPDLELSSS
jgi:hypothetical protein